MNTQPQPVPQPVPSNDQVRRWLGPRPNFTMVYCSSCGCGFGPGESGFSHCKDHQHLRVVED